MNNCHVIASITQLLPAAPVAGARLAIDQVAPVHPAAGEQTAYRHRAMGAALTPTTGTAFWACNPKFGTTHHSQRWRSAT